MHNRKSGINFDELTNKQWNIISRTEYSQLQAAFKKTDQRNGGISFYDLVNIIRNLGIPVTQERKDRLNKEIFIKEVRILDFSFLLTTAASLKKQRQESSSGEVYKENEYLDAFVALGGRADKSGAVNKKALIDIVKQQFELSLDIQTMIQGFQGENFDYETFCSIFAQDRERNEGRLASVASRRSLKTEESVHSLVIEERDFQKFLAQYENEEEF